MAFSGKSGTLTLSQLLGLIQSTDSQTYLHVKSEHSTWCLSIDAGLVKGIGGDTIDIEIEDILITRGLLKAEILKSLEDDAIRDKGLARALAEEGHISTEDARHAEYHFAESAFYEFIVETGGDIDWRDAPALKIHPMDPSFSQWIRDTSPDVEFMNQFRTHFSDFDATLYWITPPKNPRLPAEMSLGEIRILSRYNPSSTIRSFWKTAGIPAGSNARLLVKLSERGIITPHAPGSIKLPNAKPFLRALLARVVDQLMDVQKLIGEGSDLLDILKSINTNLEKMPDLAVATAMRSEDLGDLSRLTGSLNGLLDLNGVEELDLEKAIETGSRAGRDALHRQEKPNPSHKTGGRSAAGVRRQPMKNTDGDETVAGDARAEDGIARKMLPDPKRQKEATSIIEASKILEHQAASLEEKVASKVKYRRFMSDVTMAYNRFVMTKQNLFELFGVTPNVEKKDIHKAFIKQINGINPKGIAFRSLDQEVLEKAIFLRDQYKKAYIVLMDDKKKRDYIDSLRAGRQEAEDNKVRAMKLFNEGMDKIRAGKFDEAREMFRRAAKFDPNSPVYYSVLEDIDKEEREGNAVKFFQAGILAFKQKNDYDRAIKLIRKAISLRPLDPTYHLKLAEIQAMSGEHKADAVISYLAALDLDPGNQELRLLIANFQKNLGRKQEAANMYQEILKWNPENKIVQKNLADLIKEGIKPDKEDDTKKKQKATEQAALNEEFE
ncbi:tetratricopeptide repeat protein [bacterium]|nr:tetratricopeptide repeat protein [candidate division CSSED10-310 bacterium]